VLTALDNTWGAGLAFNGFEPAPTRIRPGGRHRHAGADQVPQRRRGRADGLGLHPRSVAARPPELRPRTPGLRPGPERRGAGAARPAHDAAALRGAGRVPALASWMAGRPRWRGSFTRRCGLARP
jgi:cystathionine beta-lyase